MNRGNRSRKQRVSLMSPAQSSSSPRTRTLLAVASNRGHARRIQKRAPVSRWWRVFAGRTRNLRLTRENIILANGSNEVINFCPRLLHRGDDVITSGTLSSPQIDRDAFRRAHGGNAKPGLPAGPRSDPRCDRQNPPHFHPQPQ